MTVATNADNAPAIPAPRLNDQELLSITEIIAELDVPRSTFYRWRRTGAGPPVIRLPNGQFRVRRAALDAWLQTLESELT